MYNLYLFWSLFTYRATFYEQTEVVKLMLSSSKSQPLYNPNTRETSLLMACRRGYYDITEALLEHSPQLAFLSEAQNNFSPLHLACSKGYTSLVGLLLQAIQKYADSNEIVTNLDFCDKLKCTPLYKACYYGHYDIVKLLIKKNSKYVTIDINATMHNQRTPLHAAVAKGNAEIVRLMLTLEGINTEIIGQPSKYTLAKLTKSCQDIKAVPLETPEIVKSPSDNISFSFENEVEQLLRIRSVSLYSDDLEKLKFDPESPSLDKVVSFEEQTDKFVENPSHEHLEDQVTDKESDPEGKEVTEVTEVLPMEDMDIDYTIFEDPTTGQISISESSKGMNSSNQLLISPLTEACACLNSEMLEILLSHGVRDSNGVACRIAHIAHRPDLIKLILSYHILRGKESKVDSDTEAYLELQWNYKKLPVCTTEWLGDDKGVYQASILPYSPKIKYYSYSIGIIHLDHNQIAEVPAELFQLKNVREIDISYNKITRLITTVFESDEEWRCPCLEELNVSNNRLTRIPSSIWSLAKLSTIKLSNNKLETLLPETGSIEKESSPSIKTVDLSSNLLKNEISSFIFELPGLRILNISNNKISGLPGSVWKCTTIQDLNISNNCLKNLPVKNCRRKIPRVNTMFTLHDKPSRTTNRSSFIVMQSYDYSALQILNLSNNKMSEFPDYLPCYAPNLTELTISGNMIPEIDLKFLPSTLKNLIANDCGITKFGNVISMTKSQQIMENCRHPPEHDHEYNYCSHRIHKQLIFLNKIELSGNKLSALQLVYHPPSSDTNYEDLEFYDSNIMPANLLYPNLEILDVSSNCLTGEFNPNIGHQTSLRSINLNNNPQLEKIPMEFAYLKKSKNLMQLKMKGLDNLVEPPVEYREAGLNHLLTYMKSRLKK